jgi:hypothetical protein
MTCLHTAAGILRTRDTRCTILWALATTWSVTYPRVPVTYLRVPVTHLRVPVTHLRVPVTYLRVPVTHLRVPVRRRCARFNAADVLIFVLVAAVWGFAGEGKGAPFAAVLVEHACACPGRPGRRFMHIGSWFEHIGSWFVHIDSGFVHIDQQLVCAHRQLVCAHRQLVCAHCATPAVGLCTSQLKTQSIILAEKTFEVLRACHFDNRPR